MLKTYLLAILLIIASICSCNSINKNPEVDETELNTSCQSFAKAISTSDTVMFYKLVDKAALTASLNLGMRDSDKFTQNDLFFIFFFVYSPLKIRKQDLMHLRTKSNFFLSFKIVKREFLDKLHTKVSLEWVQNVPEASVRKIELILRRDKEWKVVKAKLETLL